MSQQTGKKTTQNHFERPLAITMWDFSWLERRWPGAGYEDWDRALEELKERGYDAVRIDAFPHFHLDDPEKHHTLVPVWNQLDWGSPAKLNVAVQPALNQFIEQCAKKEIKVGLSTWFREDVNDLRRHLATPQTLARAWKNTLDTIASAGILDQICFVDLCNEWPQDIWAPFFQNSEAKGGRDWRSDESVRWMSESIAILRNTYPQLEYCFSLTSYLEDFSPKHVEMMDLLELHIWMTGASDFYQRIGYHFPKFTTEGFENLVQYGEHLYRANPEHWLLKLTNMIEHLAGLSRKSKKHIITTECWSVVDFKDWPMLDWGWIKEICEVGVQKASETGRWKAIGTSNFCGPQFHGMWRDIAWHRKQTELIRSGKIS